MASKSAIERFAAKCSFDALTGCVKWIGGTTTARGGTADYGSFWFDGRRWLAHRWAAKYIHGMEVDGQLISQSCGDPLCVEHLTSREVFDEKADRYAWVKIQKGIEELPSGPEPDDEAIPFYLPPEWLKNYIKETKSHEPETAPF